MAESPTRSDLSRRGTPGLSAKAGGNYFFSEVILSSMYRFNINVQK